MTSKNRNKTHEAFVWVWLANETKPIVAGRLEAINRTVLFNYGKSYIERINDTAPAMSLYEPELPLRAGELPLLDGLS
ncbi:MAG TPA: type II toxin-antitoxin system HipA family toxin, partial [Cellvibrionaceae bacterium]|nr:type II toxin-antitoxin system HipA family toxin [Cellvibrionaceae bacterium]